MNAPVLSTAVLIVVLSAVASPQAAPPGQTPQTAPQTSGQTTQAPAQTPQAAVPGAVTMQQTDDEGDRFAEARASADDARKVYEDVDQKNMGEVDRLLKTRRCQSTRINGLLDRALQSLDAYLTREEFYWNSWNDAESKRVESQQKSLASLEQDEKRAGDLVESDKQDREELLRRKANLEKSARTAQITAEIDGLINEIQDSEARLGEAQKQFDDATSRLNDMRASIYARLVNIRQNRAQLDTYRLEQHAIYESRRTAGQEICNTKQPDTRKSPLPKREQ